MAHPNAASPAHCNAALLAVAHHLNERDVPTPMGIHFDRHVDRIEVHVHRDELDAWVTSGLAVDEVTENILSDTVPAPYRQKTSVSGRLPDSGVRVCVVTYGAASGRHLRAVEVTA
ncbi:hypothetical protein [Nocardioides bruguierae]|uniref:hypothetical protein n=1 Tax=Nocardioides bruguierae TaxID=2945102 RepID=UPI0020225DAF|nr:hypothetical protein [Nocardioides bruguierae]MCL8026349.1 hypothetical protein [Nocardioides bruguierae]